ncbi:hypothetical protein HDU97_005955 [Phlyctochytrium planicorne]|nr:hypothetical protein HDU97_005955 [Phlyctochytrium planicorne]
MNSRSTANSVSGSSFCEDPDMMDDDDFEYDDYEGEEDEFQEDVAVISAEQHFKKDYEVDFVVHSMDEIVSYQVKEIDQVSNVLGCQNHQAAILLRHFNWNKDRLIERYMENPEGTCSSSGVITDSKVPMFDVIPGFCCEICFNDDEGLESFALSCDHRFCRDCYERFLTQKIVEEGESRKIQCAASKCSLVVDEVAVKLIVPDVVFTNDYAVECKVSANSLEEIVPTVVCKCGHTFCFGCGLPDHQPSICKIVKRWLKKCDEDSASANWISLNTKECEKCASTIEKNGGCNHMTCRKCRYEFCWVCLGEWKKHGDYYSCNRYKEDESSEKMKKNTRAALEKYLHYFTRYANHDQSAKLSAELHQKTEEKMLELQKTTDLSWIQVQFLSKAVDIVVEARYGYPNIIVLTLGRLTLKWTYCFANYLVRGNATDLFEDNQRDLEIAVEQLSELLEKPIDLDTLSELRPQILDKSNYVSKRRETLLSATAKDLQEGTFSYYRPDNESPADNMSDDEDMFDDDMMDDDGVDDDDEELEDDLDEDGFPPVVADKDQKRPYDVDFIVHSTDDIIKFQEKEVKHVAGILGCQEQHAATLLRHYKWNKERLIEKYMDNPTEVCGTAGVILDASKLPKFVVIPGFACDICCNDEEGLESLALSCNHRFCKDCYERFLTQKIVEEGESRRIQCPGSGCNLIVDEKTVDLVVPRPVHTKFCWVCLGPWADHGTQWYNCNRFDEKNSVDARDAQAKSRQALERYLHYYNRYANHEQSAKLDRDLYNKTELKMEEMQKNSELSWIEVQFLKKAVETLVQSRTILKWTYCLAYYLVRGNATDIFEDNQRDLEMAVEQLSELLEKPIEPDKIGELKQQVLDKSVYVASRREVLLTATAKDLADQKWTWNIETKPLFKDPFGIGA